MAAEENVREIDIREQNPRYWQYGGEPVLLLGGSVEDNLFQIPNLEEHLDAMAEAGGNYVRCTMSCRDEGNVWPFAKDGEAYDLERWNPEFWRRFETFLDLTAEREIFVQVELWATFDYYRDNWDVNPFNPKNNVNYGAEETGLPTEVSTHPVKTENPFFWSVPAENDQRTVLKYQRRFVDRILEHTLRHGHVLYCMDNETSVTAEWGAYWSRYVREAAEEAGRTVHTTEMWDPWDLDHPMHRATFEHPETYSFVDVSQNNHNSGQEHYDNALEVRRRLAERPRPINNVKIYGADGGKFGGTRDGVERFWRNIFAGLASARFHRPPSGIGLSETARRMLRSARQVTGAIDVFGCEPAPELLAERSDNEAYCLADPGRQYAVYFPRGGTVKIDLRPVGGELRLRWHDIDAGQWEAEHMVSGGGWLTLRTPAAGQWTAVISGKGKGTP
ncbi:MAG: putative collagen-binding domain-containing protein [Planctomycetota bacterium]